MVDEMKVTQNPPGKKFDPITIILETEEEAAIMWCHLESDLPACNDLGVSLPPTASQVDIAMARDFENVYSAFTGRYAK